MNNVSYKYPLGKKVYFLDRSKANREYECPTCLGTGKLFRKDGTELSCSGCHGKGKVIDYNEYIFSIERGEIDEVSITIYNADTSVIYSIDRVEEDMSHYYREDELFVTEEEAKKKCDELNKNLKFD